MRPLDIIFVGNPRTGKSTLCRTLSGLPFESGISFDSGLTQELKFRPEEGNTRYADTPGLDDLKLKEKAADAIKKALEQATKADRDLKLIFVCTSEAGLVYQSHVQTVHFVMNSIRKSDQTKLGPDSYAVIINKITKGVMKILDGESRNVENVTNRQLLCASFSEKSSNLEFTTSKILLLKKEEDLEDASNEPFTSQAEMIKQFVYNAPTINISGGSVERINTDTLREERRKMEDEFNKKKQEWYAKIAEDQKRRLSEKTMDKILDTLIDKMERVKITMCAEYENNKGNDNYKWGHEAAENNYDDAMKIKHLKNPSDRRAELKNKYEHTLALYQADRKKEKERWFSNASKARDMHKQAKNHYNEAILECDKLSKTVHHLTIKMTSILQNLDCSGGKYTYDLTKKSGYVSTTDVASELHTKIQAEVTVGIEKALLKAGAKISAEVATSIRNSTVIEQSREVTETVKMELDLSKPVYVYQTRFSSELADGTTVDCWGFGHIISSEPVNLDE